MKLALPRAYHLSTWKLVPALGVTGGDGMMAIRRFGSRSIRLAGLVRVGFVGACDRSAVAWPATAKGCGFQESWREIMAHWPDLRPSERSGVA